MIPSASRKPKCRYGPGIFRLVSKMDFFNRIVTLRSLVDQNPDDRYGR